MNKQHQKNLKLLADKLEEAKGRIHFEMGFYFNGLDLSEDEVGQKKAYEEVHDCNTSCCVSGFSMTLPEFGKAEYEGSTDFEARVFGINFIQTPHLWSFLFGDKWGNNIDHAVARIRFVAKHGREPLLWNNDYTEDFKFEGWK